MKVFTAGDLSSENEWIAEIPVTTSEMAKLIDSQASQNQTANGLTLQRNANLFHNYIRDCVSWLHGTLTSVEILCISEEWISGVGKFTGLSRHNIVPEITQAPSDGKSPGICTIQF